MSVLVPKKIKGRKKSEIVARPWDRFRTHWSGVANETEGFPRARKIKTPLVLW
jgi:hypothetical protein